MSGAGQPNGKKSSNSSAANTPASTPVTNGNSQNASQSTPPPPNNNAPKYGTLVPNRIFVGGISANTTEGELLQLFSTYGTVKAAKIIQDRAGVSKGYGFITFESEDDAKRPLRDAENIVLRERKLNIAPAIKKQPFNRAFDASSPSSVAPGNTTPYYFPASAGMPYFQGGVTYYQQPPTGPGDPNSQPTTVYQAPPVYPAQTGPPQAPAYSPMMFPPHLYVPQQYMPPMPQYDYNYYPNNGGPQYMVGQNGLSSAAGSQGHPMPPSNSPPRPPCYNTQLPAYTPEPVYYSMPPVYGGSMETTTVYSEALDLPNGSYAEVSQILGDFFSPGFDGVDMQANYPALDPPGQDLVAGEPAAAAHHETADQPPPPPPPPPASQYDETNELDGGRQTKTPVVSLLSMEQQQEKDFVSMQGGRRVKLQPPPQTAPQPPPPPQHYGQQGQPPLFHYNFNPPPSVRPQPSYKPRDVSHANNGWRKTRGCNGAGASRRTHENGRADSSSSSSRSSVRTDSGTRADPSMRTDSNSSLNAVDEDKAQAQAQTQPQTQPQLPLPPPVHAYHMYNGASRTYQNSAGRRNASKNPKEDNNNRPKSNFVVHSQQVRNNGQQFLMTASSMVAAARRNKRLPRRTLHPGGSPSEIGAGDAPIPNNDVAETCQKLESLKM